MKKGVLRVVAIALALSLTVSLMVSLAGCGSTSGTTDSGSSGSASSAQSSGSGSTPASGAASSGNAANRNPNLFAIEESFAKTQERNNVMSYINVDGAKRTELLTAVSDLKKNSQADLLMAIGELRSCSVQTPGDGGKYNVNVLMLGSAADYKKLTDYYKTFGGTIVFESNISLVIDYEWGRLNSCRFTEDLEMIQVSFSIK